MLRGFGPSLGESPAAAAAPFGSGCATVSRGSQNLCVVPGRFRREELAAKSALEEQFPLTFSVDSAFDDLRTKRINGSMGRHAREGFVQQFWNSVLGSRIVQIRKVSPL